jgi:hypothetical protein
MKHSTYSRRRQMVSTVKKSQATMPAACWRRKRLPGRGGAARGGIEPVTAEDGADRGGRDPHAKPEQLALDALVAQRGFSAAKRTISCWMSWSSDGRPLWRCG